MPIVAPGLPLPHLLKWTFPFVLVGPKQGDDLTSFLLQAREKFSGHLIPVHYHPLYQRLACGLLVAVQHARQSKRQMLITPMRRGPERMPLGIM
jgi:hypothetical protein